MSTKNLARTISEGGRTCWSREERRRSNKRERRAVNMCLQTMDYYDNDDMLMPMREYVGAEHNDMVGPTIRWLESQVGTTWTQVHKRLMTRWGTQSPGHRQVRRWILGQSSRLRGWVALSGEQLTCHRWARFYVDNKGLLQRNEHRGMSPSSPRPKATKPESWKSYAMVSFVHGEPHWFIPETFTCVRSRYGLIKTYKKVTSWAHLRPLSPEELEFLHSLDGLKYRAMKLKNNGSSFSRLWRPSV